MSGQFFVAHVRKIAYVSYLRRESEVIDMHAPL